jgi:hypothetical protein
MHLQRLLGAVGGAVMLTARLEGLGALVVGPSWLLDPLD